MSRIVKNIPVHLIQIRMEHKHFKVLAKYVKENGYGHVSLFAKEQLMSLVTSIKLANKLKRSRNEQSKANKDSN